MGPAPRPAAPRRRRGPWRAVVSIVVSLLVWTTPSTASGDVEEFALSPHVSVRVRLDPWQLEVVRQPPDAASAASKNASAMVLRTALPKRGRLGFGVWVGRDVTDRIYEGYSWRVGAIARWWYATKVQSISLVNSSSDSSNGFTESVALTLATSDRRGGVIDVTVALAPQGEGRVLRLDLAARGGSAARANRLGMAWEADDKEEAEKGQHGREAFFGFGERFAGSTDKRGHELYCWTEDGSWVLGREVRLPKERSTYVPIPFLLSSRGYGLLADTTYRSDWRIDSPSLRSEHSQHYHYSEDEEGALVFPSLSSLHEEEADEREVPPTEELLPLPNEEEEEATAVARRRALLRSSSSSSSPSDEMKMQSQQQEEEGMRAPLVPPPPPPAYEVLVETLSTRVLLFLGDSPAESLRLFTGPAVAPRRSLVPPPFQFGPWNQFGNEFNGTTYLEAIGKFAALDIPSSVSIDPVHFFPLGSEKGNEPTIRARNALVRGAGLVPLAYFNSMLDQRFLPEYTQCDQGQYLYQRPDGSVYVFAYKGAGRDPFKASLLDFTAPGAAEWFQRKMQEGLDLGYGGWMYDYGEYVSPHTTARDGRSGAASHNAYPLEYQQVAFDFFATKDPDPSDAYAPPFIYYVRSGYTGTQAWVWNHWTGDPYAGWDLDSGLAAQVKAQLTLGLSGIPFSGSDIGGFVWEEPPSEELWLRWTAVGAASGTMHTQTGGTSILGKPKTHVHDTPRGTRVYRKFAKLRTALFPYLYTAAHEAHACGLPLMRHHFLMFPSDRQAWAGRAADFQYSLGASLLVAPVVTPAAHAQRVYLPRYYVPAAPATPLAAVDGLEAAAAAAAAAAAGATSEAEEEEEEEELGGWYDVSTRLLYDEADGRFRIKGNVPLLEGGQTVEVPAPLDTLPTFVRSGTVLPTLDPSVGTLSRPQPPSADSVNATTPTSTAVSYAERRRILHLWAWADKCGRADSGVLWDGSRVSMAPRQQRQGDSASTSLLCSFVPPATPTLPYDDDAASEKDEEQAQPQPWTFVLQLALPASWPHPRVAGVAKVGQRKQESSSSSNSSPLSSSPPLSPVPQAPGGWRDLVSFFSLGASESGAGDAWAWDGEEQQTLWVRVSTPSPPRKGEDGTVQVLVTFES